MPINKHQSQRYAKKKHQVNISFSAQSASNNVATLLFNLRRITWARLVRCQESQARRSHPRRPPEGTVGSVHTRLTVWCFIAH